MLEKSDLSSPPVEDIRRSIWAKLLRNLGTSSLCTLTGVTLGEVRSDANLSRVFARLGSEGRAIARALGVEVERAPRRSRRRRWRPSFPSSCIRRRRKACIPERR